MPAQTVKVHRAMGEHDMSMPVVAGDEQQVRAAHAEPFGALVRRHSMAAQPWTESDRCTARGWALGAQIGPVHLLCSPTARKTRDRT